MLSTKEYLKLVEEKILSDEILIGYTSVIQVWYCKSVQNHKGLFILKDDYGFTSPYFVEATYNGDKNELYLDFYTKDFKRTYSLD